MSIFIVRNYEKSYLLPMQLICEYGH